jgi:hypothetical protein
VKLRLNAPFGTSQVLHSQHSTQSQALCRKDPQLAYRRRQLTESGTRNCIKYTTESALRGTIMAVSVYYVGRYGLTTITALAPGDMEPTAVPVLLALQDRQSLKRHLGLGLCRPPRPFK